MVDREPYKGALIRVPADIKLKGLSGCTEIIGSLRFELQEGTGNVFLAKVMSLCFCII